MKLREQNRLVAFAIVFAIFMLGVSSFAQVAGATNSLAQTDPGDCGLVVSIEGKGEVQLDDGAGNYRTMDLPGEVVARADCDQVLRLIASPQPLWQFQEWRVDGVVRHDAALDLTAGTDGQVTAVFAPREVRYLPLAEPVADRDGRLVDALPVLVPAWESRGPLSQAAEASALPEINVWYGERQPFGLPGVPQSWMNILGSVDFLDNNPEEWVLDYRLNGGPFVPLNFGGNGSVGDGRRLYSDGDFVVDLALADLLPGNNVVIIRAINGQTIVRARVVVVYSSGQTWPIPANVDWDRTGNLLDEAAVVDGEWAFTSEGNVRTAVTGYDRLLNVGDIAWESYEAVVPVTVHSYDDTGFTGFNFAPALGIVMGWQGHTDTPISCGQPKCGWLPVGMATWYEWDRPETGEAKFKMWVKHTSKTDDTSGLMLDYEQTYLWKVQVDRDEGTNGVYRLKVWEAGTSEPGTWLMALPGTVDSQELGSLLLLAHHVDVTFGDVQIRPLDGDFDPPQISDIVIESEETLAQISWQTDEPASGIVEYFSDPDDVTTIMVAEIGTEHEAVLGALEPGTDYTVRITATDESLNQSAPVEESFATKEIGFTLQVDASGFGTVTVSPEKPNYGSGEQVTLTAVSSGPMWVFTGWQGDATGRQNPLVITMSADTTITAVFEKTVNYLPFIVDN